MHPTLFHLGPIPIRSYGFMMMLGFMVCIHLAARRAKKCGADEELVLNLGLISLITGVIGARIFYVIHYLPMFLQASNPIWAILNMTSGGLEFYGGFLAAVAGVVIYLWKKKRSIRLYMDILAPAIMLGLAFGRIGCFLNGCCWGAVTKSPCAVRFPYGSLAFEHQWRKSHDLKVPAEFILTRPGGQPMLVPRDQLKMTDEQFAAALKKVNPKSVDGYVLGLTNGHLKNFEVTLAELRALADELDLRSAPVHPTQLYSCFNAVLISVVLGMYFWRRKRHGSVFLVMFVVYPISRILLEAIRTDNPHDMFGLTVSQGISVVVIPLALLGLLALRRMQPVSLKVAQEKRMLEAQAAEKAKGKKK